MRRDSGMDRAAFENEKHKNKFVTTHRNRQRNPDDVGHVAVYFSFDQLRSVRLCGTINLSFFFVVSLCVGRLWFGESVFVRHRLSTSSGSLLILLEMENKHIF